ncbi:class I SAM-dependent methyltransferase [Anaerovorax odorimutans]|uniref:class I SAM-dependent methyltransferase n=1 Tax=Anaerovorax odorimutans TaxID=109327 RepID=UPI000410992D|nr:class I SAM-dependent methyltransferase [Anaerovorax odorimutans]
MSEKHRAYFNEKAEIWDQMMKHKPHEKLKEIFADLSISNESTVLDVGTGTGVMIPILKNLVGSSGNITAFDISEEMLLRAKLKNGEDSVNYVQGDIEDTSFETNTFDVIICNSCFPHFLNKQASVKEMARILKLNGRVIICHLSSRRELNSMHKSLGGVVGEDILPEDKDMILMFREAGFKDINIIDENDRYILTANFAMNIA